MSFSTRSETEKDNLVKDIIFMQKTFKDKLGKFCYPAFGTLLGIVREQDFIKDDTDIDMMWHAIGETREEVLKEVFVVYHKSHKLGIFGFPHNRIGVMKAQVTPELRKGGLTYMDMCVSWMENGDYWTNIFGDYKQPLDMTPRNATLRGEQVLIPQDAEKFLRRTYGDWKTPKSRDEEFKAPHIRWGSYLL